MMQALTSEPMRKPSRACAIKTNARIAHYYNRKGMTRKSSQKFERNSQKKSHRMEPKTTPEPASVIALPAVQTRTMGTQTDESSAHTWKHAFAQVELEEPKEVEIVAIKEVEPNNTSVVPASKPPPVTILSPSEIKQELESEPEEGGKKSGCDVQ